MIQLMQVSKSHILKKIAIYEQDGIVRFGKNPLHTEATNFQNDLHTWQREQGLRGK